MNFAQVMHFAPTIAFILLFCSSSMVLAESGINSHSSGASDSLSSQNADFQIETATANNAGQLTYEKNCAQCHDAGVLKAPVRGARDFTQRVQISGYDSLWESVLKGKARMPKRGGCFSCSDRELQQALDYLIHSESQGS